MKKFFTALCWFTMLFGTAKFVFAVYGLMNTSRIAQFIMMGVGADSAAHSGILSKNLARTTLPFLWGLLVSSLLLIAAAYIMKRGKRIGFYLYAFTSALLAMFFFYGSFNYFPVLVYGSVLPLVGTLLYVTVLEYFWYNGSRHDA